MARNFGGRRMQKEWTNIASNANAFTGNSTASLGGNVFGIPGTIMRCIGEYVINPTSAPTALDRCIVTVALGVVSGDALVAGASAFPDPADEPDYPWLFLGTHPFFFGGTSADPNSVASAVRHRFDVKSMRKVKPGQALAMVAQYEDGTGIPPMTLQSGVTRFMFAT